MLFPKENPTAPKRVVITGAGMITALGHGWKSNAEGFRNGKTAFRPVTLFDVSKQRVKTAAEVDMPPLPETRLHKNVEKRLDRAGRLLLHAVHEAWQQSGTPSPAGVPIVLGTTSGGMALGEHYYKHAIQNPLRQRGQATRVTHYLAQSQPQELAKAFGFTGCQTIIANACASGANAVGHAFELARSGQASRVVAAGYDALSQMVFSGFDSLQALSPTTCRPFDENRDGLALGEGAAAFVIETLEGAKHRGADILGEIIGYGAATDSHHLTQPHPAGDAAVTSMTAACESAGLKPKDIGYINAHGTGTPLNDSAEAAAISRWAGIEAQPWVSSTKGCIGHLLGAAGAVEVGVCLMALRGQWLPPQPFFGSADPACSFRIVSAARDESFEHALSNSFGFGGANASIVLRRWS